MNFFKEDNQSAFDAKSEAQRIAFAPMVFQASRILRDSGILELVQKSGATGMTLNDVAAKIKLPRYGIKVLLEAGLGIGLFCLNENRFTITKLGYFILRDEMTRVNMDVVHDICYRGLFDLDKSIEQGKPVGLKTLDDWKTFYEGLSTLRAESARKLARVRPFLFRCGISRRAENCFCGQAKTLARCRRQHWQMGHAMCKV